MILIYLRMPYCLYYIIFGLYKCINNMLLTCVKKKKLFFNFFFIFNPTANMSRRKDGRLANQLRPMAAEMGLLKEADGSARMNMGKLIITI